MTLTLDDLYLLEIALAFLGNRVESNGLLDRVKAEIKERMKALQ